MAERRIATGPRSAGTAREGVPSGLWHDAAGLQRMSLALLSFSAALLCYAALHWLVHRPEFAIDQVVVSTAPGHVTRRQIEDVVRHQLRGNVLTLDLAASRLAFLGLPWVREARLQRDWPGTLTVDIVEHEAIAVWQDGGLVNREGDVFQGATEAELPVFGGPPGSSRLVAARYAAVQGALAKVGLTPRAIEMSSRHTWHVDLQDGPRIEFGQMPDLSTLEHFLATYPQHVEPLLPRITRIDLRYRNGYALRSRDGKPLVSTTAGASPRKT